MSNTIPDEVNFLDCTLRDGGYYTNWDFAPELVSDYVATINTLPVRMVELGLVGKPESHGYFANVTSSKAEQAAAGLRVKACVMIDAKDVLASELPISLALTHLTEGLVPGHITTVRVAVHYSNLAACRNICTELSHRGFRVFLNLMQIDAANAAEVEICLTEVKQIDTIDVLYIADSFGSMKPARVQELIGRFAGRIEPDIGFHGHDSRGYALVNSVAAAMAGATWIDCTMGGMGRGAGNTASEQLLPLLTRLETSKERALLEHVLRHFKPLRKRYGWGSSAAYQFAGSNFIHPSYVQKLCEGGALSDAAIIRRLSDLRADERMSFDNEKLSALMAQDIA
ncbi:hypothetical protein [Mesorhizobium sp.]|uniref:hypothetical protein n=1 Tax=Mesorhizobium sp. TaxID=1871066 RepID=UPI000FE4F5B3|nr:hypothetical protein [Mesorhizobium sp.]RWI85480.1 MAG: hypothetical protein EOR22_30930 [Mesorhizobium sp.]RWO39109.1 MAG: hypothetical protein EOS13_34030 [Mesorhizobium sp.]TIN22966.1 MAG: hypothetical protein E5Y19_29720 [Mesorhizobium sp.]TIO47311.1 MAG: hypothetical protein E5X78_33110 [Mesorhizobium sp.]TIO55754.1 MAG: hypothetical protein E5X79_33580 [Mesorhizobium sp.]